MSDEDLSDNLRNRLIHEVEKNLSNSDFSLSSLAQTLGYNMSYLSLQFKNLVGENFREFLLDKRLEKARLLLLASDYKIFEISNKVGILDENYFAKCFKKKNMAVPAVSLGNKNMMRFKKLNYFSVHISLAFLISSLSIILLFSMIVYNVVSNIFLNEAIHRSHSFMQMSRDHLTTYLDSAKSKANTFSNDPELLEFLNHGNYSIENIRLRIDNILSHDELIKNITVVSKDGRIISNNSLLSMQVSDDMMKEDWYINAINTNMPVLSGARMQDKSTWVIALSSEIQKDNRNLGVLLFDLDYSLVERFINPLPLGKNGALFILNHNYEPVYHTQMSYVKDHMTQKELVDLIKMGSFYHAKENLLHYQLEIENSDWIMHGIFSLDGLVELKRQLLNIVVMISIALLLLSFVISTIFSRNLRRPLNQLIKEMENIEKLNNLQIDKNAYNEIVVLSLKYNEMISRIKRLLSDLKMHEESLKEAEIAALVSQINPHFLYNTLDTIVWMAEFNEKEKVIDLTKSLALFFRLSLNNGNNYVTLENEVKHVMEYLFIQKQRYEDSLKYELVNQLEGLDLIVPKIILQPLVENALYHGIKKHDGVKITIQLFEEPQRIIFEIHDDGKGNDFICHEFIRYEQFVEIGLNKQQFGVGMRNVHERIAKYFGANSGLWVKSEDGFIARIVIAKSDLR